MSTTWAGEEACEAEEAVVASGGPALPMGRRVALRGRGTTFVREVRGPAGAPTVLLLHGWMASGGLNWFQAFEPLSEQFNVVALDQRGHGRGIHSRRRFTLADCADDAAALLDTLGTGPVIAAGYSLGGPVAQLLWKRHPDVVSGLVLCATSHHLMPGMREQMIFSSMMAAAAGTTRVGQLATRIPARQVRSRFGNRTRGLRPDTMRAWARAEMGRHDWRQVLEAGVAMSNYHAKWIGEIDVPTTVVVTTQDRAVNPFAQLRMALKIPGAQIQRIEDGHIVCAKPVFGPAVVRACEDVAARIDASATASTA
ncbi:MAG: alpha/beta hydrolase [Acidimicrobiia bacterium]|nr:alpha/beta hydrolase [Acidimicrobiia bacterium]